MKNNYQTENLLDVVATFSDKAKCYEFLSEMRWGGNVKCPRCGTEKPYISKSSHTMRCSSKSCKKQFNAMTGTAIQGTRLPIQKWMLAMYMLVTNKRGVSSTAVAKQIGITQKTAWFLLHRLREILKEKEDIQLEGIVESDETFVGGKNKNRHKNKKVPNSQGRSFKDKTPVLGMMQRGGKLVTVTIPDTSMGVLEPLVRKHVKQDSVLMTDEWAAYRYMRLYYEHCVVDHAARIYSMDGVSTNKVENFWSHFKRGLTGVYYQVSKKHLQRYCDEFTFRFNTREIKEGERLLEAFKNPSNRLSFKSLVKNV